MKGNSVLRFLSGGLGSGAFLVCVVLLVGGCLSSQTPDSKPVVQSSTSVPIPSTPTPIPTQIISQVEIPVPPSQVTVPKGSPQEQAVALANAVSSNSPNRLAGWLAVYDALAIPVLGSNHSPLGKTGDDPIGPAYWRVWYMSGMTRPGTGFELTDLTKTFNAFADPSFDNVKAGAMLLADVRAAVASKDPQVQLFGRFMAEIVKRGPSPVDILDPKVTADQVVISGDTAELLSWVVMRDFVFSLAKLKTISTGERPSPAIPSNGVGGSTVQNVALTTHLASTSALAQAADSGGCTSLVDDDSTYWLNWAVNKVIGGGVQLPGMGEATKGLVQYVQEARGRSSWQTIEKVKSITSITSAVANVLTLAMQISALTLDSTMEPSPLERTKETSHGKQTTIVFRLTYEPGNLPDGRNLGVCLSSYMLNAFGVSLSFPASGARVAGAELTFTGEMGFAGKGDYVLFGESKQLRQDTNSNGEVELKVLGRAQKRVIPANATPVHREFSISVRGQPEAANGNSIANTFFDSLLFWVAPGGAGLVNSAVDVAKTFHWDLGEPVFPIDDWATGYEIDEPVGEGGRGRLTGTICEGLDKPFKVAFSNPADQMSGAFTYTPSGSAGGTYQYSGTAAAGKANVTGTGGYKIEGEAAGVPSIVMEAGVWTIKTKDITVNGSNVGGVMKLLPAGSECSK